MKISNEAAFRNPIVWAISFGFWTVAAILNSASEVIDIITGDASDAVWEVIVWECTSNYTFAFLTPFTVDLGLRLHAGRLGLWRAGVGHASLMVAFSLAHVGGMVGLRKSIYLAVGRTYEFGNVALELLYEGFKDTLTYMFVVAAAYGFDYYRRFRERELLAARLETSLAEARLDTLRHRMEPHFLFNTLNLISATMHEDVEKADRIITRLSDLLRTLTEGSGRQRVALEEEIRTIEAYLEIMQARFEDQLTASVDVAAEAAGARVPSFLLQPIVENAIKHGIAGRENGGRVEVKVRRRGARLEIEVRDDGPGTTDSQELLMRQGVGLSSTAERLRHLYGDDQSLQIRNSDRGGLVVTISIPHGIEDGSGQAVER